VRNARAVLLLIAVAFVCGGCRTVIDPAAISEAQTAAQVKTRLVNDPEIGELAIEVRVVRGVAELSGRVRSAEQIERARRLAAGVPGVIRVETNLQVGGDPVASPTAQPAGRGSPEPPDSSEFDPPPGLLAVGGSIGWSVPRLEGLRTRVAVSPLVKLGSPRGLGPAVGFDWFQADLESVGQETTLTRVHVKPVMAGLGYTFAADRLSFTPSVVGGVAFNSLTVTSTGAIDGLPIEIGNSLVWRVGASAWYDVSRRVAMNVSAGYLMTGIRVTFIEQGRLAERHISGDTAVVHAGVAYRLF
jgi:hypothetical protein